MYKLVLRLLSSLLTVSRYDDLRARQSTQQEQSNFITIVKIRTLSRVKQDAINHEILTAGVIYGLDNETRHGITIGPNISRETTGKELDPLNVGVLRQGVPKSCLKC